MSWDEEAIARLRLARTAGVGPLTFSKFLQAYSSARDAIKALPGRANVAGRRSIKLANIADIEREIRDTDAAGARILFSSDADYPTLLRELSPAPPVITVLGDIRQAKKPCIAMVGARNASAAGMRLANTIANDLGAEGYTVVSGLARGIDTAAHNGALETGTVAVIAGGIDNIYPPQNRDLRNQIAEQGLVLSESPFGHDPRAKDFPRRNRLITGLSLGVIVVEAAQRSGSLISARCAAEQGRDVMAVPGSPLDPRTRGSNGLIRSGAALIESARDVLDVLSPQTTRHTGRLLEIDTESFDDEDEAPEIDSEIQTLILQSLSPTPISIADLSRATSQPVRVCTTILVELELAGLAVSLPGGLVQRTV